MVRMKNIIINVYLSCYFATTHLCIVNYHQRTNYRIVLKNKYVFIEIICIFNSQY